MNTIETIRAKIERLLEFDKEVKTDYYIGRRDAKIEILAILDTLPEQPAGKGLEKAAEEYAENTWLSGENWADAARRTFKAGAEWMAAQGVNHELEVKADAGGYPYIDKAFELYDYTDEKNIFNPGDKVIVQIRKK